VPVLYVSNPYGRNKTNFNLYKKGRFYLITWHLAVVEALFHFIMVTFDDVIGIFLPKEEN